MKKGKRQSNWIRDTQFLFKATGGYEDADCQVQLAVSGIDKAWEYVRLFYPDWTTIRIEPFSVIVVEDDE